MPIEEAAAPGTGSRGYALIEVLVACALLVAVAAGTAQAISMVFRATLAGRTRTAATVLASQKLELLRSVVWHSELAGAPPQWQAISDTGSDLSADPPGAAGVGLAPSPAGTLESNVPPYVDHLDASGRWVGSQPVAPPGAVYTRRWSIQPLPGDPDNTVVIQVLVTTPGPKRDPRRLAGALADGVLVECVKTRRAR